MLNVEEVLTPEQIATYKEWIQEWARLERDNVDSGNYEKNSELQAQIAAWMLDLLKKIRDNDLAEAVKAQRDLTSQGVPQSGASLRV